MTVEVTRDESVMERVAKFKNDEGYTKFFVYNNNKSSEKYAKFISVEANGFFAAGEDAGGVFQIGVDDAAHLISDDTDTTRELLFSLLKRAVDIEAGLEDTE
ncbi:hypothetical protein [Vibrio crassostreae]|uniref:hypothetical protein n=1 Tax=Vibrio crassostreae TaxID=246167 RepID=UPI001B314F45|nr:hypothetical protein [Vibrio crassostreae]